MTLQQELTEKKAVTGLIPLNLSSAPFESECKRQPSTLLSFCPNANARRWFRLMNNWLLKMPQIFVWKHMMMNPPLSPPNHYSYSRRWAPIQTFQQIIFIISGSSHEQVCPQECLRSIQFCSQEAVPIKCWFQLPKNFTSTPLNTAALHWVAFLSYLSLVAPLKDWIVRLLPRTRHVA